MRCAVVAVSLLGLVCRGPVDAPAARARPTEAASAAASTSGPPTAAPTTAGSTAQAPQQSASSVPPAATAAPRTAGTEVAAVAAAETGPAASSIAAGGPASGSDSRRMPLRQVAAVEDYTAVLLAPVVGSPAAGQVPAGALLTIDAAVFGEVVEGSPDWYFVVHDGEPSLRGFVHSSRVRGPS